MNNWRNKKTDELFEAFLKLKTTKEVANFCRDLMTEAELDELAGRWQVAILLDQNIPQRKVSKDTGVSIATVTRVNQWLKRGMDGYQTVLNRTTSKHQHPHLEG